MIQNLKHFIFDRLVEKGQNQHFLEVFSCVIRSISHNVGLCIGQLVGLSLTSFIEVLCCCYCMYVVTFVVVYIITKSVLCQLYKSYKILIMFMYVVLTIGDIDVVFET